MKIISILVVFCFLQACKMDAKINKDMFGQKVSIKEGSRILLPSGELANAKDTIISNIKYTVAVDSNNKIIYVQSIDPKFIIDKVGVGVNASQLTKITGVDLEFIKGWGGYIKINSSWYAGFDYKENGSPASAVKWLFMFDFNHSRGENKIIIAPDILK